MLQREFPVSPQSGSARMLSALARPAVVSQLPKPGMCACVQQKDAGIIRHHRRQPPRTQSPSCAGNTQKHPRAITPTPSHSASPARHKRKPAPACGLLPPRTHVQDKEEKKQTSGEKAAAGGQQQVILQCLALISSGINTHCARPSHPIVFEVL